MASTKAVSLLFILLSGHVVVQGRRVGTKKQAMESSLLAATSEEAGMARRVQAFGADADECTHGPKTSDTTDEALSVNHDHMHLAARFEYQNVKRIVAGAQNWALAPVFDKSPKILGDETYEQLVRMQIDGLKEHDIRHIEDKVISKKNFERIGVTPTTYFYAAHVSDYNSDTMREAMEKAFASGITSFIVKPSHMAWSKGLLIVRENSKTLDEVDKHIREEVISKQDENEDSAHLKTLEPGVIIEALFGAVPGQKPQVPLEVKVTLIWGEVYAAFFVGQDQDGCLLHNEEVKIYGDNSSWGLTPARRWIVDEGHWDKIVKYARMVAKGMEADVTRADFFLAPGLADVELNEVESVSGHPNWNDRRGMGEAWRLGYTAFGKFDLTKEKVEAGHVRLHADRDILEGVSKYPKDISGDLVSIDETKYTLPDPTDQYFGGY